MVSNSNSHFAYYKVEFLLDGVSTAGGDPLRKCNRDKWRPWVMTWISSS